MAVNNLYDTIGVGYAQLRKPDPRIAAQIDAALGEATRVLNVGAGTGSYEPQGRAVTALEPSAKMIAQRPAGSAPAVQGCAEGLPFADNSFDAAMAVLTVHHWTDKARGFAEMRRVSRGRVVVLTYDPAFRDFWLLDYFPALAELDEGHMPQLADFGRWLGPVTVSPVPVPHDCTDGFLAAYWRRPRAYLDERVRSAMSPFWALGDISSELASLSSDIDSGVWETRYGHLLALGARDCGYRLVVADAP
ncbi:class I SAM-dependent methyltransferase [Tepidamorphus sp. 3E244]|uniref:class I SAM-dependent methyltransferase n=1 Tax=Tepidamorphus sp. 3E244 TaxID=3385498 RepID=UPI0038FBF20E